MIPKASIDELAQVDGLLPTTVDKDYVLGWLLYGIAVHPYLSQWVFKGGTCLKKCFFETYRFSEDLDMDLISHDSHRAPRADALSPNAEVMIGSLAGVHSALVVAEIHHTRA